MKPVVSIIIATYNEEKNISDCLSAIYQQDYPRAQYEIIIVDDHSTDNTVRIGQSYGARIVTSGYRHIERSKSIGIRESRGKYLLFIDADIVLCQSDCISLAVDQMEQKRTLMGAQVIRWEYSKKHSLFDRYCELFGVNDPFVYMLGKRGVLAPFEKEWMDSGALTEKTKDYSIAHLNVNSLRTFGSQGFMLRKSLLIHVSWKRYFFHLDVVAELVSKGYSDMLLLKRTVRHRYVSSFAGFHKKLIRNLDLYYQYKKYRTYSYGIGSSTFFVILLAMVTGIVPLLQSIYGYSRKPDSAWFLHPILCITVPVVYSIETLMWYAKKH